jgi:hypothetical protein
LDHTWSSPRSAQAEWVIEGVTREKIHRDKTELRKLLRYLQHTAEGRAKDHAAGIVRNDGELGKKSLRSKKLCPIRIGKI